METTNDLIYANGPTAGGGAPPLLNMPPPSDLVKTFSNVSTTSTVTIDSAFSDSSTSPKSVCSKDNIRGIPPKSPHSLPPLPSFNGRARSLSTESFRKRGGLDPRRSPSFRKKGRRSSSMSAGGTDQSSMGSSVSSSGTPKSENERLLRKLRKAIKRYGEKHHSVAAIYTALGNLHFREGRTSEAINSYKGAIECSRTGPHSATAFLNLGTAYWRQMDVPQSSKYLKKALKALQAGCSMRGVSPEMSPEIASCHHQLGLVYALGHQHEAAVYEIETACRMRLTMYGAAHPMTARTLDAAGRIHTLRGDYEHALHCHEQALTVLQGTPYATSTLENIAMAHTGRGDVLAAVHVYVEIVQSMKALWHFELSKPYYQRNQAVAQQLADFLQKLGASYRKLRHDAYANQCKEEAEIVLLDSGLSQHQHLQQQTQLE